MAIVEMSPNLASGLPQRMLGATYSVTNTDLTYSSIINPTSILTPLFPYRFQAYNTIVVSIYIQGGTAPSNFSGLVNAEDRASDRLITFGTSWLDTSFIYTSNVSTNPAIINSIYASASASGIATWFRILVRYSSGSTVHHQIIGKVGTLGSGEDLELPSTNIIAGQAYRILNLRLQFPTSWDI